MNKLNFYVAMRGLSGDCPLTTNQTFESLYVLIIKSDEKIVRQTEKADSVTHDKVHCHFAYAASAASFLPFSTASSMVPTM